MAKKYILGIDTATRQCSVALSENDKIISKKSAIGRAVHNKKLTNFIESTIHEAGLAFPQIDGIAVNIGPGSFTGLRIGLSTAKGLAYPGNIPILPISAFAILEEIAKKDTAQKLLFIRSHRNYIYYSIPQNDRNTKLSPEVKYDTVEKVLREHSDLNNFYGDFEFTQMSDAGDIEIIFPSADIACRLGYSFFSELQTEDHSSLEPQYLTSFEAKKWKPGLKAKDN